MTIVDCIVGPERQPAPQPWQDVLRPSPVPPVLHPHQGLIHEEGGEQAAPPAGNVKPDQRTSQVLTGKCPHFFSFSHRNAPTFFHFPIEMPPLYMLRFLAVLMTLAFDLRSQWLNIEWTLVGQSRVPFSSRQIHDRMNKMPGPENPTMGAPPSAASASEMKPPMKYVKLWTTPAVCNCCHN